MNLTKLIPAAALAVAFAAPALAADIKLTGPESDKIHIKCDSTTCRVKQKAVGKNWKTIKTTQGGSSNFDKLQTQYKEAGYK